MSAPTGAGSPTSTVDTQRWFAFSSNAEPAPTSSVRHQAPPPGKTRGMAEASPNRVPQQSVLLRHDDSVANSESTLPSEMLLNSLRSVGAPQVLSTNQAPDTDLYGSLSFGFPMENEPSLAGDFNYFDASSIFPTSSDAFYGMDLDFDQLLSTSSAECLQSSPNTPDGRSSDAMPSSSLQTMSSALGLPSPLESRTKLWLGLPFIPQRYDLELIALLLTVAQRHLSTTFLSFKGQIVDKHTLPVQIIAMAAFGALFSGCPESYDIGKLLFTDSLRMVADTLFRSRPASIEATGSFLKAMVALELCGLCSGHTRSNEIGEAYHQALVQMLTDLRESSPSADNEMCTNLCDDVLLLEAYRVILLQLQPLCLPGQAIIGNDSELMILSSVPDRFPDDSGSDCPPSLLTSSFHELAHISVLSYFTFAYLEHSKSINSNLNWRPETLEVYIHDFATKHRSTLKETPSLEILLRTNLWIMRAPVELFHRTAYEIVQTGHIRNDEWASFFSRWRSHPNYHIMTDHVVRVLDRAEELVLTSQHFVEAPHDAFCTYLGTLALCVSQIPTAGRLDEDSDIVKQIRRAMKIMGKFRAASSDGMARILSLLYERVIVR